MPGRAARVTTVVPTYRRPALLSRALDSVLMQTFGDLRVRVYDNASGDETESVVREHARRDARVEYYRHADNIGSERNFAFGLDRVDTEYFSFLSDDDLLLPRLYELTVEALDATPQAAMAATGVIHANGAGAFAREPSLDPGVHRPPDGLVAMLERNQPAWTGTLFRTELVKKAGGIDPATVIDLDLELRLAAHHQVVVLAPPGAILMTENHFGKCLAWPGRFAKTIAKLCDDEGIPFDVRRLVNPSLEQRLHAMVYQTGVVASRMGRTAVALEAARVLRDTYADRRGSFKVAMMAQAGRLAPLITPAYKRMRSVMAGKAAPTSSDRLRAELQAMAPALIDRLTESSAA